MKAPLAALLLLSSGCALLRAPWRPPDLPAAAEHLLARTADGWDLSVIHYAPVKPTPFRRPVLLLHGIATNERNLDFDERHSLARWLAARGLDVYAMSLRATGESAGPQLVGPRSFDWDFDSYVTQDLPAAIALVQAHSGSPRIDFVGHSLGGMILYALLARGGPPAAAIAAAATLGSPTGFRWGPRFTSWARTAAAAGSHLPLLSFTAGTLLFLPTISAYPTIAALIFYNPRNMAPSVWEGFLSVGVEDESPALAAQAARWLAEDRLTSRDGKLDYSAGLQTVTTPILVVAGKVDQLGFPPLVRRGYDALKGPKRWLLVAEENGASADYGHMDLLLGDRAPQDVFLPVARWLEEQAR